MSVTTYDNSSYLAQRLLRLARADDLDTRLSRYSSSGLTLFLIILDLHVGEGFQDFS